MRLAARRQSRRARRRQAAAALLDAGQEDTAPEISLINLVDLMLVFAVGLMLAVASHNATSSREPGSPESPLAKQLATQRMKLTGDTRNGTGTRVGIAYRLQSGEIIYVPEAIESSSLQPPATSKEGANR